MYRLRYPILCELGQILTFNTFPPSSTVIGFGGIAPTFRAEKDKNVAVYFSKTFYLASGQAK